MCDQGGAFKQTQDAIESRDTNLDRDTKCVNVDALVKIEGDQSCVEELYHVINKHPLNREIFYKILETCETPRFLADLENAVASFSEFQSALQSPYWYINRLVEYGGLDQVDFDEEGRELTGERIDSLPEEEIEEMIADSRFATTVAGKQIVAEFAPKKRLEALFERMPARKETFIEVLEYCEAQARPYSSICNLLKGRPVLEVNAEHPRGIQPSVFVDFLEKSSVIVWGDEGWRLSDEGREILKELRVTRGTQ